MHTPGDNHLHNHHHITSTTERNQSRGTQTTGSETTRTRVARIARRAVRRSRLLAILRAWTVVHAPTERRPFQLKVTHTVTISVNFVTPTPAPEPATPVFRPEWTLILTVVHAIAIAVVQLAHDGVRRVEGQGCSSKAAGENSTSFACDAAVLQVALHVRCFVHTITAEHKNAAGQRHRHHSVRRTRKSWMMKRNVPTQYDFTKHNVQLAKRANLW